MLHKRKSKIQKLIKKIILLYMPTIFHNSLLMKAISDQYREFKNAVKKVQYKEKKYKSHIY